MNDSWNQGLRKFVASEVVFGEGTFWLAGQYASPFGGYLDPAHGECNAMLLRHVVGYNFKEEPERFKAIGGAMGLNLKGMTQTDVEKAIIEEVGRLSLRAGIKESLAPGGVRKCDTPDLARRAIDDVCLVTNPRPSILRDLEVLYEEAL